MLTRSLTIQHYSTITAVFLIVTLSRLYYVETFAVALPYWDQWDAEGDFLLRPWIEGRLKLHELWQPHNEHRIFPTRILSIVIFELSGSWNNLIEARINILLAASIPAILIWLVSRNRQMSKIRWLIVAVIIAQFALPFSFENLLVGFQSQFYFLILFTIISIIIAIYRPINIWSICILLVLNILSILTMASGLLTPITVAAFYFLKFNVGNDNIKSYFLTISLLIAISIAGYLILPQIPSNQIYRARNISDLVNSLGYILSWPFIDNRWAGIILWLPALIAIPIMFFRKNLRSIDLIMAGFFIWSFCQALAIAYGRGQELTEVASRYTELFSLGLIANAWFAIRLIEILPKYSFRWIFLVYFFAFFYGHATHYQSDMHDIRRNYKLSIIQTQNVQNYLKSKNIADLQKPKFQIPYPDPLRLQQLLDNPTIHNIFPPITNPGKP
jgi:hypothetical protein